MSLPFFFDWEPTGIVLERYISVRAAARLSGYSVQYLRRLLRAGRLKGTKVGQVWLIDFDAFEHYLEKALTAGDDRYGPQASTSHRELEVVQ